MFVETIAGRPACSILPVMAGSSSNQEIEIKLRVADVAALRRCLKHLRARESSPRTYEFNTLYDTPKKDLGRRGRLIRIRFERTSSHGSGKNRPGAVKSTLTYKGPAQSLSSARITPGKLKKAARYKIKEEIEVAVSNGETMQFILNALGLHPVFRYEKFRTTFTLLGVRNLKIELDETPIGTFLELEGAPPAIDRAAKLLGYTRADYITTTYGALYIADCRLSGHRPADMLFLPTRKLR
jgi:adenylate cyclase class 2